MSDAAKTSIGGHYSLFDPASLNLAGKLTVDELITLRGRDEAFVEDLKLSIPRLVDPLLAIAEWGDVSAAKRENSIIAIMNAMASTQTPYWQWDKARWLALQNQKSTSRPYLTAIAYHLGGLRDVTSLTKHRNIGLYARAIYGSDIFWREHGRLMTALSSLGYSGLRWFGLSEQFAGVF